MPTAIRLIAYFALAIVAQLLLLFVAFQGKEKWLLAPLAPGLYAMRLLPDDPLSAGSFIRFPTLPQTILAFTVNAIVYVAIAFLIQRFIRRRAL